MRSALIIPTVVTLLLHSVAAAAVWPSTNPAYDEIEELYTVTTGYGASGFSDNITPCSHVPVSAAGLPVSGRQTAAEWARLSFHDASTHDHAAGTGGMDASIQFELARAQNIGDGQISSLNNFYPFYNAHRSMSDLIALGLVLGVRICGGPGVAMSVGRVDAVQAGPETVPTPDQDLASHTAAFDRMGFSQAEMIGVVACGHSLGGVHQADFPNIVQNAVTPTNQAGVARFDNAASTLNVSNNLSLEFLSGKSIDPLVVNTNQTLNSDARIFASDGNVTIQTYADDIHYFGRVCFSTMGKMINLVPAGVTLSNVITPYPVVPHALRLSIDRSGSLTLSGAIRIFELLVEVNNAYPAPTFFPAKTTVNVSWSSGSSPCASCSQTIKYDASKSTYSMYGPVGMYPFTATIDSKVGVSSLFVSYTPQIAAITADNGGTGSFPVQDKLVFYTTLSCTNTVFIAIRNNAGAISSPYLDFSYYGTLTSNGVTVKKVKTTHLTLKAVPIIRSPSQYYSLYSAVVPGNAASFTAGATVGGKAFTLIQDLTGDVKLGKC